MVANSGEPAGRAAVTRHVWRLALAVLIVAFVGAVLAGSSARANPGTLSQTAPTHCTPPTNPYNTSTTVATCGTTTTVAPATVTLSISYRGGHVLWRSCVNSSASGSAVQLYLGPQGGGSAQPVDNSQIGAGGCTPDNDLSLCLAQGSYTATAVDEPYGQASQTLTVNRSGCGNPTTLAASAGQSGGTGHIHNRNGSLAFTGIDIALIAVSAAVLLAVGLALVKVSKQRRHVA